jgi:NitT/TauT family transport system permease protein
MNAIAVRRGAVNWAPALIVAVAVVGLWEGIVKGAHIQRFLLPAPDAIWSAFRDNQSALWHEGWFTFQEALGGFALGCGVAILFAIVVARWNLLGNAIFPVFVNTVRGLKSVKPQQLELMRSYAVGELTVFRLVRIPTALPFVFTALRVASVLAMIGAIVGEYYGGSLESLGANINQDASLFQFEKAWAEIVIACIFGIGFYLAVALAERFATRWQPRVETAGA